MSKVLIHHGVKGQKWGVRRYQNSDGTRTTLGKARTRKSYSSKDSVFISGKVKYDRPLDESLKKEIDKIIKSGSKILIGDAPGADTRVQDYLASKGYSNVVVYTTDKKVRNNVGNWKVERISGKGYFDEKSIRQQKDIAMTQASTRGLAIMPFDDRPDSAMSLNVQRMNEQGTPVLTYDYERGVWHSAILCHHGIKGQKWGIKNGPPYPINDSYFYLPSKTKMFRSSTSKTSFTDGRKYTYVNITDKYYNHAMSVGEGFEGRFKYDLYIESTKKLKMAKLDTFLNTLFDVIGADKTILSKRSAAEILCDERLIPHEYKEGDLYGGAKTNPVFLKVIDELIKKGYDGVEDPVDASIDRKNDDMYAIAAIIFNPSSKLQITNVYEC